MEPFRVGAWAPLDPLPADPRYGRPELEREARAVRTLQRAADRVEAERPQDALRIVASLASGDRGVDAGFDPDRLAWIQALAHLRAGDAKGAAPRLAAIDLDRASFEVAAAALVGEALVREAVGETVEARALRQQARSRLDARPGLDAPEVVGRLREAAGAEVPPGHVAEAAARLPLLEQVR